MPCRSDYMEEMPSEINLVISGHVLRLITACDAIAVGKEDCSSRSKDHQRDREWCLNHTLSTLTAEVCHICGQLESIGRPIPESLVDWWKQHKIDDARRELK